MHRYFVLTLLVYVVADSNNDENDDNDTSSSVLCGLTISFLSRRLFSFAELDLKHFWASQDVSRWFLRTSQECKTALASQYGTVLLSFYLDITLINAPKVSKVTICAQIPSIASTELACLFSPLTPHPGLVKGHISPILPYYIDHHRHCLHLPYYIANIILVAIVTCYPPSASC